MSKVIVPQKHLKKKGGKIMEAKIVYIAYPITKKDQPLAISEIIQICGMIHTESIIPFIPYFHMLFSDGVSSNEIELRKKTVEQYFAHKFICEVWVYGEVLSWDVLKAIRFAHRYRIPVIPKTDSIKKFFNV